MSAPVFLRAMVLAALVCLAAESAQACPGCKDAVTKQKNGMNIAMGYQYSIMFMMAMPFTMLGLFSAYMYWEIRRAQAAKDAERAAAEGGSPASQQGGGPANSAALREVTTTSV